jgi:hypothetical protein
MRSVIIAAAIIMTACSWEPGDGAMVEKTPVQESPATAASADKTAGTEKTGIYIARGSFSGGESLDGRDVYRIGWSARDEFERIEIDIRKGRWDGRGSGDSTGAPCRFTVSREDFPARLLVLVNGTRMFSAGPPEIAPGGLVEGFYRIVYLDDAGSMFAFDVDADTEFEVFETCDPARIVIDVRGVHAGSRSGPQEAFSLRSLSWRPGEGPGHFEERLLRAGAERTRILRDDAGDFCVEEGWYATRDEAEKRQEIFGGKGIALFIEERGIGDIPRHMTSGHK